VAGGENENLGPSSPDSSDKGATPIIKIALEEKEKQHRTARGKEKKRFQKRTENMQE